MNRLYFRPLLQFSGARAAKIPRRRQRKSGDSRQPERGEQYLLDDEPDLPPPGSGIRKKIKLDPKCLHAVPSVPHASSSDRRRPLTLGRSATSTAVISRRWQSQRSRQYQTPRPRRGTSAARRVSAPCPSGKFSFRYRDWMGASSVAPRVASESRDAFPSMRALAKSTRIFLTLTFLPTQHANNKNMRTKTASSSRPRSRRIAWTTS